MSSTGRVWLSYNVTGRHYDHIYIVHLNSGDQIKMTTNGLSHYVKNVYQGRLKHTVWAGSWFSGFFLTIIQTQPQIHALCQ